MTFSPENSLQSFLPTTLIIPDLENEDEFNYVMSDYLKKSSAAVNEKDIGQYLQTEVLCGQKFFNDEDTKNTHSVYRKVIDFGALPASSAKTVPHGIDIQESTRFTRIYGTANSPSSFIPLPYADSTAANSISLEITELNVEITTAIDYSAYTETYVVVEYYYS